MKPIAILTALVPIACLWSCASQDDLAILGSRMARMEAHQQAAVQEQGQARDQMIRERKTREEIEARIRDQAAQLRVLIEELRVEVARVSGKVEESEYHLKQRLAALEDAEKARIGDAGLLGQRVDANQQRLTQIANYLNLEPAPPAGPSVAPAEEGGGAPAAMSDSQMYAMAKKAFDNKGFETALEGFQKLIKAYPKSEHADNAQFWIGEIYYREKWYEKAILEYQKVIEKYSKGNKVRAALLKQGFAFDKLGDKANARLILKELVRKHPRSNEAKIAKKKLLEAK